jgi:hypothetical protein
VVDPKIHHQQSKFFDLYFYNQTFAYSRFDSYLKSQFLQSIIAQTIIR